MELLCINDERIIITGVEFDIICDGHGLENGKIFETLGEEYMTEHGLCYYITGLGSKLSVRFTKAITNSDTVWTKEKFLEPALN